MRTKKKNINIGLNEKILDIIEKRREEKLTVYGKEQIIMTSRSKVIEDLIIKALHIEEIEERNKIDFIRDIEKISFDTEKAD